MTATQIRRRLMTRWREGPGQEAQSQLIASIRGGREQVDEVTDASSDALDEQEEPAPLDLRGINLAGENLDGVDLVNARLQMANLARASFRGARLTNANLGEAFLRNADFTEADLRGANLRGAIMENTRFDNANLVGARVSEETIAVNTELPSNVERPRRSSWFAAPEAGYKTGEDV